LNRIPSRAYDNGIHAVFSNAIGMNGDQLKNPEKFTAPGGHRYKLARRPELYADILGLPNQATQKVSWVEEGKKHGQSQKFYVFLRVLWELCY
jgi:hypothetical protein